jgi:uncharacterized protein (TIGR02996 family)
MTDTISGQAILADIIAHPDEDWLRLALADWLEENGQSERAAAIRSRDSITNRAQSTDRDVITRNAVRLGTSLLAFSAIVRYTEHVGFLIEVTISEANWLSHGPEIARNHPLERVTLMGKRPRHTGGGLRWHWLWSKKITEQVYYIVRDLIIESPVGWATPNEALDALSARAIAWARSQAEGD